MKKFNVKRFSQLMKDVRGGKTPGATFNAFGAELSLSSGYLVSILCMDLPQKAITGAIVRAAIEGLEHRASIEKKVVNCFGAFNYGNGFVSVDANQYTPYLSHAIHTARACKQVAIWDCAAKKCIMVKPEGKA